MSHILMEKTWTYIFAFISYADLESISNKVIVLKNGIVKSKM